MNIGYYHTPTETLCNEELLSTYILQSTDFTLRAETQRTCLINPWGWQQMCIYVYTTVSLYCFVMYIFCWWHENKPLLTYLLTLGRICGNGLNSLSVQWRHIGASVFRIATDWLFNNLSRPTTKDTSGLRITSPLWGNPSVSGGFPTQRATNAETISM